MVISETTRRSVIVHPRANGAAIDVFRKDNDTLRHETFRLSTAGLDVQNRIGSTLSSINKSKRFLGLNMTISAILLAEGMRRRSKVLTVAGAVLGSSGIYISEKEVTKQRKELDWLEREATEIDIYKQAHT